MSRAQLLVLGEHYPHPRKIQQAVDALDRGGVIAYPTDTVYGYGCDLHNRKAIDRIYRIKGLDRGHRLSFICPDISSVSNYASVTDFAYRWMRRLLPGPYTVLLNATRQVPKVLREKRKEVGIRIPDNAVCSALVNGLGRPVISTSARDVETGDIMIDAEIVRDRLGGQLDLVLDGGLLTNEPSTVVSLMNDEIEVVRHGKGPVDILLGD
jgi:tRNA threonylcarbamoyl adenosine modification protein (Sua5/YciO/YrdC/YwlC family)